MDTFEHKQPTCSPPSEEVHKAKHLVEGDTEQAATAAEAFSESGNRSPSPEPNCSICLGKLQNKSFTDGCFHTFCFTCLLEWSKVKAECPLCKQVFKSIIHNVRSIEDYDQYYVNARLLETSSWQSQDGRRFRYPSTLTAERRRHLALERMLEFSTFTPQHMQSAFNSRLQLQDVAHPQTSNFRRRVYEEGLWVRPYGNGVTTRIRDCSPEFFRRNPACTHRLVPWLNRELNVLLQNSESQVSFVLELILALITRFDIRGPEFREHLQPYFQDRTSHFIHEFYNFTRSPHNIVAYDQIAEYDRIETCSDNSSTPGSVGTTDDVVVVVSPSRSSVDDSVIFVPRIERVQHKVERAQRGIHPRHMPLYSGDIYSRKLRPCRANADVQMPSSNGMQCNVRLDVSCKFTDASWADANAHSGPSSPIDLSTGLPGPSRINPQSNSESLSTIIERSGSDSESDCVIIGTLKPKSDRTPEVVDLVTSSDCEVDQPLIAEGKDVNRKMSSPKKSSHRSRRKHSRQSSRTRSWSSSSSSSSSTEDYHSPSSHSKSKRSPITKHNLHKYYLHKTDTSSYGTQPSTSRSRSSNHKSPHSKGNDRDSTSSCSPERRKDKPHKKHSKKTHKLRSVIGSVSQENSKQSSSSSSSHKHAKHKKHKKHHKSRHHSPPF